MKLNKNSWHAKWWLMNNRYLPDSLCPYFWGLIWLAIRFPFTWVGYLLPGLRNYDGGDAKGVRFGLTFATYMTLLIGNILAMEVGLTETLWSSILYTVAFAVMFLVIGVAIMGSIFGIIHLVEQYKHRKWMKRYEEGFVEKPKKEYIIVEWWKGFKGKYCPRVDWN